MVYEARRRNFEKAKPKGRKSKQRGWVRWVVALVVIVVVQLIWSKDKLLPLVRIGGVDVGMTSLDEAVAELSTAFSGQEVSLVDGEGRVLGKMGVELDFNEVVGRATDWPVWMRLIPGSALVKMFSVGVGEPAVAVEEDAVREQFDVAAMAAEVKWEDGEWVIGESVTGKRVDMEALRAVIEEVEWQLGKTPEVELKIDEVEAVFTTEDAQKLVDGEEFEVLSVVLKRAGERGWSVVAEGLGEGMRSFSVNGEDEWTAASTYKLFVAYSMIRKVENGELTWDSRLSGVTLERCLETMIVDSDNSCPEAWLARYGFGTLQKEAREIGAVGAKFAANNMRITAQDLVIFLKKLYEGRLMGGENREKLLGLMKRQTYRNGVPAGISDGVVADKVGFLNGLLHDAGIVFLERGDYVLVVMSYGGNWGNIAEIARVVEKSNYLYR